MNKKGLGLSIGLASIAITGSIVSPQLVKAEGNATKIANNRTVEILREEKTVDRKESEEVLLAEKAVHTDEVQVKEAVEVKNDYAAVAKPVETTSVEVEETKEENIEVEIAVNDTTVEEAEEVEETEIVELAGEIEIAEETTEAETTEEATVELAEVVTEEAEVEEAGVVYLSSEDEEGIDIPEVESEEKEISIPFDGWLSANMNVRQQPSTESTILGVLPMATKIEGRIKNGWLEFEYNNQKAYLLAEYLSTEEVTIEEVEEVEEEATVEAEETTEEVVQAQEGTKQGYVTSPVNVRDAATMQSNILGVLPRGTEVTGVRQGQWIEIDYNGQRAFVSVNLVGENAPAKEEAVVQDAGTTNSTTEAIVQEAHDLLGYRYVYGSHSPSTGFDCSGLVYYLYQKHAGVTLNRSSYQMVNNGYQVSKDALKPGDVLLFNSGGNSRISHVGLYIGNGEMIHASTPRTGVIKSSITSGYFANTFVTARRIID